MRGGVDAGRKRGPCGQVGVSRAESSRQDGKGWGRRVPRRGLTAFMRTWTLTCKLCPNIVSELSYMLSVFYSGVENSKEPRSYWKYERGMPGLSEAPITAAIWNMFPRPKHHTSLGQL